MRTADPAFEWGDLTGGRPFRLLNKEREDRFVDQCESDPPFDTEQVEGRQLYHFRQLPGISELKLPGDNQGAGFNGLYYDTKMGRFWATYWTHNSTTGTSSYFATLTAKSRKLVFVNPDAADIDLTPERTTYAMVTPRDLAPYGKRRVWFSRLYIGDWTKPLWKEIKFGRTVDFKSVAIRP